MEAVVLMRQVVVWLMLMPMAWAPCLAEAPEEGPPPELAALVPASGALEGLAMQEEPRYFSPDRLADYINGDAETYYTYGVGYTVAVRYSDGAGGMLSLDIYDMRTPLGAFGVYAQRRPSDPEYLDLGSEAYVSGNQVVLITGQYYVVARSISRNPGGVERAKQLAQLVAEASGGPEGLPVELAWFPEEGLLAGTFGYSPRSFLGLDGMPPLFTARYAHPQDGEDAIALGFYVYESEEDLAEALEPMSEALAGRVAEGGDVMTYTVTLAGETVDATAYDVKYRGQVHVTSVGRVVMVAARAPRERAEELFEALAERIEEDGPGVLATE